MPTLNDLPLELLRMILQALYNPKLTARHPSFYSASCISRKWVEIAYDLNFSRFSPVPRLYTATIDMIPMTSKLRELRHSEELRVQIIEECEQMRFRRKSVKR